MVDATMPPAAPDDERPWYKGLFSGDGLLSRDGPGGAFAGFNGYMNPTAPAQGVDAETLGQSRSTLLGNLGALLYASSMPGLQQSDRARMIASMPQALAASQEVLKSGQDRDYKRAQIAKLNSEQRAEDAFQAAMGGRTTPTIAATVAPAAAPAAAAPGDGRDAVIRTMIAEAGGEGETGLTAVGHVINNRATLTGLSPQQIVQQPNQFEPWGTEAGRQRLAAIRPDSQEYQKAAAIYDGIRGGQIPDPTGGGTHFLNPTLQTTLGRPQPAWATPEGGTRVGQHVFYRRDGDFSRTPPAPAPTEAPAAAPAAAGGVAGIIGSMNPEQRVLAASLGRRVGGRMLLDESLRRDTSRPATPEERTAALRGRADDPNIAVTMNTRTGAPTITPLPEPVERTRVATDQEREEYFGKEGAADPLNRLTVSDRGVRTPSRLQQEQTSRPPTGDERTAYSLPPGSAYTMDRSGRPVPIAPPATNVTVNTANQELDRAGKRIDALRATVDPQVRDILPRLQGLQALVDSGVQTGSFDSLTLGARSMATSLGLLTPEQAEKVNSQQLFRSMSDYIIPRMRVAGTGSSSDLDVAMFQRAAPDLAGTPEGQRVIIATMSNSILRDRAEANLMEQYVAEHKNLNGFDEWAKDKLPPPFQRATTMAEATAHPPGTVVILPEAARGHVRGYPFFVVPASGGAQ